MPEPNETRNTYVQGHSSSVLAAHSSRTADSLCRYLLPTLHAFPPSSSPTLLDIGCGPGSITTSFSSHLPSTARIIGIDFSPETIEKANTDPAKPPNVTFETGDAFHLRWDDGVFDIVHANYVLMHLTDPVAVLKEMRRVCKRNGIVACREAVLSSTLFHPETPPLSRWRQSYIAASRAQGNHPDEGKELITHCLDAGFKEAEISFTSENMTYTNGANGEGERSLEWWANVQADRVSKDEVSRGNLMERVGVGEEEMDAFEAAWRELGRARGGVYSVWCGCVIARKAGG